MFANSRLKEWRADALRLMMGGRTRTTVLPRLSRIRRDMTDFCHLLVRVTPRSGRDEIAGWQDGVLRIRLKAPPVEGQANESLRRLLAQRLGLPVSNIELTGSTTSRRKRLRVSGLTEEEVRARLP